MRKWILGVAAVAMMWAVGVAILGRSPKPTAVAPDSRYAPSAIGDYVVRDTQNFTVLMSDESMDGIGRGTGVLVDSMTVLTCAHMLSKDHSFRSMWVYPYPGARVAHIARIKFINYPNDLALLELDAPILGHKAPAFARKVEIGEPIVVVGNINGYMLWFVSYGIISGEHDRWVLTDATIRGGNSGGPWVNARGEIVALTDVGWQDKDGHSVGISGGVPVQALRRFMAEARLPRTDIIYAVTGE